MTARVPARLHNIQSLRGIAALMVVFSHLRIIEQKYSPDQILPDWFFLGITGVDLFFVISGFIMVYVTWNVPPSIKQSLKFLYARVTRIYPLYWFVAGLVYLVWRAAPGLINFDAETASIAKSFLLWPQWAYPMVDVAWTLIYELYFYLVFALILLFAPRLRFYGLCAWFLLLLAGNFAGLTMVTPEFSVMFSPLCAEFFMGALAGTLFMYRASIPARSLTMGGLALGLTLSTALVLSGHMMELGHNWLRVFEAGLPAMFITLGLAGYDRMKRRLSRPLESLGNWSYSLYLTHVLTLSVCGLIWREIAVAGAWDNILAACFMVIASIIAAYLTWRFVEQPMLRLTRRWRRQIFGD